jgi:hypothetical protein
VIYVLLGWTQQYGFEGFECVGSDSKSYTVLPFVSRTSLLSVLRCVIRFAL